MKVALRSLEERAIEWFSALVMCAWGVSLLCPGQMLTGERFAPFHRLPIGDAGWAMIFLTFGTGGLVVLWINGRRPQTPYFRVARAFLGFVVYLWMVGALADPFFQIDINWLSLDGLALAAQMQSRVGPGWMVYGLLSVFELFSIYRATKDTRYLDPSHCKPKAVANDVHP